MRNIHYLIFALVLSSCEWLPFIDEKPKKDSLFELVWSHNFGTGHGSSIKPVFHEDLVIFSAYESPERPSNKQLVAFDRLTGEVRWTWADVGRKGTDVFSSSLIYYQKDGILVIGTYPRAYAIDMINGTTIWRNWFESNLNGHIVGYDDKTYMVDLDTSETRSEIIEMDLYSGEWRTVFEVAGGIRPWLTPPAIYHEEDGDRILLMMLQDKPTADDLTIPNLISYNLTRDSVYYKIRLTDEEAGAVDPPILINDKLYMLVGPDGIQCRDPYSGDAKWQRNILKPIVGHPAFIEDFIIVSDGQLGLHCLDAEKGWVRWEIQKTANGEFIGGGRNTEYYNGYLFHVGGGNINIIDPDSGEVVHAMASPTEKKNGNDVFTRFTPISVDQENGLLYLGSWSTAFCYRIRDDSNELL